jgi:predicted acetyltransferase
MEINFSKEEENYSENKIKIIKEFSNELIYKYDTFYEETIIFNPQSTFYYIQNSNSTIGFIIINEKEKEIYSYYLTPDFEKKNNLREKIFMLIKDMFDLKKAFIYSIDYLFLNLLLSHQEKITVQGNAPFIYNNEKIQEYENLDDYELELIEYNDENIKKLEILCNDEKHFIQGEEEIKKSIENKELYYFLKEKELIGIGVFQKSKIFDDSSSIGMMILKEYRNLGMGTMLLKKLHCFSFKNNITTTSSGCSSENFVSKKTIEKSFGVQRGNVLVINLT